MSDNYVFGKKISDLDAKSGTIDIAQTLLELEQGNLASGERSRKATVTELGEAIVTTPAFGTAAEADLTTSATDTTAGRVLKVGDFGLGKNGWSLTGGDFNALTPQTTRFFTHPGGGSPSNAPVSGQQGAGISIHGWEDDKATFQLWARLTTGDVYTRVQDSVGNWSAWSELYHSGNYPSDTAWTTVTSLDNGWTGTVRYIKWAGWVTLTVDVDGSSKTDNVCLTLPSGYRTGESLEVSLQKSNDRALVASDGTINTSAAGTDVRFTTTYPVIT